jgi:pSer/pThr/pTyr-binding forkhead associated (FHA) protein
MQVALRVLGGKNDGREIAISVPEFVIGRGEDAHLRPASDLVSRHHCAIRVNRDGVIIVDLNSRNGTFVNGNQITEPHVASVGDTLRVGRLQFQILIDHVQPGSKKPKVDGVVEAAARTANSNMQKPTVTEESITDWLSDAADEGPDKKLLSDVETVQLRADDTNTFEAAKLFSSGKSESAKSESTSAADAESGDRQKKKPQPGKLPPRPKFSHDDSTTAADDVLRRFFNRR